MEILQGYPGTCYRGREVFSWRERMRRKKFSVVTLGLWAYVPIRGTATVFSLHNGCAGWGGRGGIKYSP